MVSHSISMLLKKTNTIDFFFFFLFLSFVSILLGFWATGKDTTFASWITSVSNMKNGPLVHSVSYGQLEEETDHGSMDTFSTTVKKLGVQGISVVVSSGDDGVANPKARTSSGLCGYTPQWPAVCPWVTTVGATQGPEEFKPEVVCSSENNNTFITSGGGFANTFVQPSYQKDAVSTFLSTSNNSLGAGYNAKGRGYPDVALIGHLYPIINGGVINYKDGTSASTPVMAAILALVNDARLSLNKSSVGFANPTLYSFSKRDDIYHDITKGKNNCCAGGWSGSTVVCCPKQGFRAVKGWDPVSGLGSINVGNLIDVWSGLP
jgi:tripeptidyl-peptidase I